MKKVCFSASLFLKITALAFVTAGFVLYCRAYSFVTDFHMNYIASACVILAVTMLISVTAAEFLDTSGKPFPAVYLFESATVFLILYSFAVFLSPFIDGIATYFTVVMGDMATKAQYVYRSIIASVFFVLGALLTVISSFFPPRKKEVR